MRILRLCLLAMLFVRVLVAAEDSVVFPRTPAPSPDGEQVAFSFQGDIWVVPTRGGEARRLTANPAYDYLPRWSPDGKRIAFSSDRYGNDDVFVLSLEGKGIIRLTYFSNNDRVWQFLPDETVLFSSRRNFYYHRLPLLYRASLKGGTPAEVMPEYADQGKISPDGRYLVFIKGRANIYRKHYRGSSNCDIFLYDFADKTFRKLTDFDGNDMFPVWSPDGKTIYFASEQDGTMNLYRMNRDGSGKTQLTFFKDDGIRYVDISANGNIITFERGFDIYRYDVAQGKAEKIELHLPLDYVANPIAYRTYTSHASEMAVSPDGKFVAFVVRGEVLVMDKDGHFLNQLTETPFREGNIFWAPNSDSLLYVSDESGNRDIYLVSSGDPRQKSLARTTRLKREKLIAGKEDEYAPRFSPDGKRIAFIRGKGDIVLFELKSRKTRTLVKGWSEPEFRWSPDSRYLAYAREDEEANSEVFVIDVESGTQWDISQHPDYDGAPRWSADGRRIAFVSARRGDNYDIWMAYLRLSDDEKTDAEWEEFFASEKGKKNKPDSVRVVIDQPEKLYKRLRRVTALPGAERDFDWSPDGQFLVFSSNSSGKADLWKVKWNGKELKQLTHGGLAPRNIVWHGKNKQVYFLKKGGLLASASPTNGKVKTQSFSANLKIDIPGEQKQKFDEAWRTLAEYFYDPHFHGVDWKAMYRKYLPVATGVYNIRDFNSVVRLMLGELNASHLGIYPPSEKKPVTSGMLALRYDWNYRGEGLKISEVIPNGPCQRIKEPVQVGEILLAVDGVPLSSTTNLYALLENRVNQPTELLLKGKKNGAEYRRTVVVRPVSYNRFMDLEYDRWREEKRELVHKLSHNRLGYIHIRAMGRQSLEQFEMELYAEAHGKDGLVIDVRNNGGGWTTDYLLNMLMIRDHAYTIPRDGKRGYPQTERRPLYAWTKPIIVLCNEYSYSNAEIFSHAIKTLKRGKLVGKPTGGLVISTGSIELIDGSRFRVPFRGWYVITDGTNMENHGAVPDIIVEDHPGDTAAHIDRQLTRAVQELMSEL